MGNDHEKAAKSVQKEQQEGLDAQQQESAETAENSEYTQFSTRYDSETSAIWCWMQPEPRPCLNAALVDELFHLQQHPIICQDNVFDCGLHLNGQPSRRQVLQGFQLALCEIYPESVKKDPVQAYSCGQPVGI